MQPKFNYYGTRHSVDVLYHDCCVSVTVAFEKTLRLILQEKIKCLDSTFSCNGKVIACL